jgi:hypothetical protein
MSLPSKDAVLRFTIKELRDLAKELNINIASLSTRDDILEAVLTSAYADLESLPASPERNLRSPTLTSAEDVLDVGLATPTPRLQNSDFPLHTSALPFQPLSMPMHTMHAATSYPSCMPAMYFQPSMPLMAPHMKPSTSIPPGFAPPPMSYAQAFQHMHPSFAGYAGLTGYGAPVQPAISEFDKWQNIQEMEHAERESQADRELNENNVPLIARSRKSDSNVNFTCSNNILRLNVNNVTMTLSI